MCVITGVMWKDTHTTLSTGKDNLLIQHVFKDALRPADSAVPSGVDISIHGDITLAYKEKSNGQYHGKSNSSKTIVKQYGKTKNISLYCVKYQAIGRKGIKVVVLHDVCSKFCYYFDLH